MLIAQTLIFPTSSWTFAANSTTGPIFNAFRQTLTEFLSSPSIETQTFEQYWNSSGRQATYGANSSTYLDGAYTALTSYNQWNNFGAPWIADCSAQNEGRIPFINPTPLVRWAFGCDNVTQAIFEESEIKKQVYSDFVQGAVLQPDAERCSRAIYLAPNSLGTTNYRVSLSISHQSFFQLI